MSILNNIFGNTFFGRASLVASTFKNLPKLETERLILCKITEDYAEDMFEYASDADVTKYLTWYPHSSVTETRRYIQLLQKKYNEGVFHDFGILLKENGKFIGTCGYTSIDYKENTAEIGYVLSKEYWGREIMPEAVKELMKFGFEKLGFSGYNAKCMEGNDASTKVMSKCGMTFEGMYRHSMYIKGEFKNIIVYKITKEEFYEKIKAE
ncbi:MAG: GNAT family N-acetyltransferase [Clostridia bacterium]|nr:GNAT family N-acetyltransferase [Clostridia bacterium]